MGLLPQRRHWQWREVLRVARTDRRLVEPFLAGLSRGQRLQRIYPGLIRREYPRLRRAFASTCDPVAHPPDVLHRLLACLAFGLPDGGADEPVHEIAKVFDTQRFRAGGGCLSADDIRTLCHDQAAVAQGLEALFGRGAGDTGRAPSRPPEELPVFRYPEWDERLGDYLPEHVMVCERQVLWATPSTAPQNHNFNVARRLAGPAVYRTYTSVREACAPGRSRFSGDAGGWAPPSPGLPEPPISVVWWFMLIYDGIYAWEGFGGQLKLSSGRCRLQIFDLAREPSQGAVFLRPIIVIASDVPDSRMSVRSCAGHVATSVARDYKIDPHRMLFVEYYPQSRYGEHGERVIPEKFEAVDFHWTEGGAIQPKWRTLHSPLVDVIRQLVERFGK